MKFRISLIGWMISAGCWSHDAAAVEPTVPPPVEAAPGAKRLAPVGPVDPMPFRALPAGRADQIVPTVSGLTEPGELIEGFTSPHRLVDVATPESGTIEDVPVRQGQLVKKGDVLAVLDRDVLIASLAVAKAKATGTAKRDAALIELEVKQRRLDKLEQLGKALASSEELERAKADVELVRTQVSAAEQELRLDALEQARIQAQLDRRTIRSPLDGIVVRLHHEVGEFVPQSDPKIATVVDLTRLRIVFHPPTRFAEQLAPQDKVPVRMPRSEQVVTTELEFISPLTNADSGSVRMEVLLDNPSGQYRSGVRCTLVLDDQRRSKESAVKPLGAKDSAVVRPQ